MENVIEVKHLNKSFGTHEVLKDIDFSVEINTSSLYQFIRNTKWWRDNI